MRPWANHLTGQNFHFFHIRTLGKANLTAAERMEWQNMWKRCSPKHSIWRAGEPDSRREPPALMPVLADSISQVPVPKDPMHTHVLQSPWPVPDSEQRPECSGRGYPHWRKVTCPLLKDIPRGACHTLTSCGWKDPAPCYLSLFSVLCF